MQFRFPRTPPRSGPPSTDGCAHTQRIEGLVPRPVPDRAGGRLLRRRLRVVLQPLLLSLCTAAEATALQVRVVPGLARALPLAPTAGPAGRTTTGSCKTGGGTEMRGCEGALRKWGMGHGVERHFKGPRLERVGEEVATRRATSVRQIRRDQKALSLTASDTGRSRFLLSSGCNRSGYCRAAGGAGVSALRCRTVVTCPVATAVGGGSGKAWNATVCRLGPPGADRSGGGGVNGQPRGKKEQQEPVAVIRPRLTVKHLSGRLLVLSCWRRGVRDTWPLPLMPPEHPQRTDCPPAPARPPHTQVENRKNKNRARKAVERNLLRNSRAVLDVLRSNEDDSDGSMFSAGRSK